MKEIFSSRFDFPPRTRQRPNEVVFLKRAKRKKIPVSDIFQRPLFLVPRHPFFCMGKRIDRVFFHFCGVVIVALTLFSNVLALDDPVKPLKINRERLEGIVDDSPLARSSDKPAWDYLFKFLDEHSQIEIEQAKPLKVGFMELDRQPVEYRGRFVRITGRLLRCEFVPLQRELGPFDQEEPEIEIRNDDKKNRYGFYKSWVQVADRKDTPICVCSLQIPKGFPVDGNDLNEAVAVTGIFYKRQLYLSSANEEVSTPTILAKTFRWNPDSRKDAALEKEKQTKQGRPYFIASILTLLFLWICLRFMVPLLLSRKRLSREKINFDLSGLKKDIKFNVQEDKSDDPNEGDDLSSPEDDDFPTPSPGSDQTTIIPKVVPVLLAFLFSGIGFSLPAKNTAANNVGAVKIDAEFTREQLFQMDELSWNALGDERVPWDQQRDEILAALDRLSRFVPYSFLKNGISKTYAPMSNQTSSQNHGLPLAADSGQFIGKAFELKGTILNVEEIELNPLERKMLEVPAIYRCRMLVPGQGCADILTRFVPCAWLSDNDQQQNQFAVAYAIYIKRLHFGKDSEENSEKNAKDKTEEVPLAIRSANDALIPLLIAPKIEWYPANPDAPAWQGFLGSIGMDVGSFDLIPAMRIANIKKKRFDDLSPALQFLSRNEIIQRTFKFTEADRDPFYGLLHAAKSTPPGRIEQEARRELETEDKTRSSAVRLFNDPAGVRGKPVLLTGTAKRVLPTLVEDKEVHKLYGIDKYYQIYLFTKDSQNNPLIVCVTSLPDGMPVGSDDKYAEQITVGAIPYKLWVYESSAKLEGPDGEILGNKPAYAPLLIGRSVTWHPTKKHDRPLAGDLLPTGTASSISFGIFIALFALWIGLRRFRSDKPIEFKLRK